MLEKRSEMRRLDKLERDLRLEEFTACKEIRDGKDLLLRKKSKMFILSLIY